MFAVVEIIEKKRRDQKMFCPSCGNPLVLGARFCGECGGGIDESSGVLAAAAAPQDGVAVTDEGQPLMKPPSVSQTMSPPAANGFGTPNSIAPVVLVGVAPSKSAI